ncbi:FAD-binding oxidoreductase [Neogemmobacter tilapiae]|uniref:FAD-linked oxidase n=1 Tax=Neogemmobacter tilapiae TaxID=875041 RepID=A0A918WJA9_9RHOB|nr:FAD-binding oxidoreductase [Gemmobacter tilapiae]GHC48111.1 FAD-linked oxidase [Gemmobacter tilapiae]
MNLQAFRAELADLEIDDNPTSIRAKSRDFFWYSPVLKARMDHLTADLVISPRDEAEVIRILRAAFAHDAPVTVRGSGTGNYGQAMPMRGGVVLHMKNMTAVKSVHPGRVIVEPGCLIKDLDAATRKHSGQELRMHPSTWATATIGGFIGGGSGGVGSVTWGVLRDLGNILRLRVVTMEAEPRVLEFTGEELHRVSHAYGTNGIITEVEMPLAPAYDWVEIFVTLPDWDQAVALAGGLADQDGILKKLISVYEAPTAKDYFQRVAPHVDAADHLLGLMIAPQSMDGFLTFLARFPSAKVIFRSDAHDWPREPGAVFEYGWNHTTLRALKVDPSITYLQVRYAPGDYAAQIAAIRAQFPGELIQHLEAMRENGRSMFAGLTLVKFTSEERLDAIIKAHEAAGAMIFNPHRYTLEEGGRQSVDSVQLDFKRQADPKGLLNPGKMITWDRPDWDYARMYDYADMRRA